MAQSTRHILLVEDDESHAELIRRALECAPGVALTVVHRLCDGVNAARDTAPDLVVADLTLPDGRGVQMCGASGSPVIIMTSQGSETDAVEAMRAGALDYVVKSDAMFADLPHVVDRALREWDLRRAHDLVNRQAQAQLEIASALAESATLEEAGGRVLQAICGCVGWPVGELWRVDAQGQTLRRVALCAKQPELRAALEPVETSLGQGEGIPGTAWALAETVSAVGGAGPAGAKLRPALAQIGLSCAFAVPVRLTGNGIFAVLAFFAGHADPSTGDIDRLMQTISAQLSNFAQRQREREERLRLQAELAERQRLAAVGTTAATLAHEIANPLNGMYVHLQLLKRRVSRHEELDAKIGEQVDVVMAENRRLNGLLDDFRCLSRRGEMRRESIDLVEVLRGLIRVEQLRLEQAGIDVSWEVDDTLPPVSADSARLHQVFLNLVKNAIEAMTGGGQLTLRAFADSDAVVVEVADTGGGIPEGIDVFTPFQTSKDSGTGLGLAIARDVISAHGGHIACAASSSEGTIFRVQLPAATTR